VNFLKRIQYNSPVILTFAFVSLAALGLDYLTDGNSNRLFFMVYRAPLSDPLMYLRLFTHAIGHSGMPHFIGNFILILLVGPMLEERYGSKFLVIAMVVTAFVTGLLHILFVPGAAKLGASGIVFMLMLLASFVNIKKGRIPLTLILAIIVFIGREIISSATADINNNIAYMSHIVGGICGAVFGLFANKEKLKGEEKKTEV